MDATVPFRGRIMAEPFDRDRAHPGHDPHTKNDINGIGDFESDFGQGRVRRPHNIWHDEQGAAGHRTFEQAVKL